MTPCPEHAGAARPRQVWSGVESSRFSQTEHLAGQTLVPTKQAPNKYPAQPETVNLQGEGFCAQRGPKDKQHLVPFWLDGAKAVCLHQG